jgi:hypothetical protein
MQQTGPSNERLSDKFAGNKGEVHETTWMVELVSLWRGDGCR